MTTILSSNLKKARHLKGWSQEGAAKATGIDRTVLARYETAKKIPSEENYERICLAFGITDTEGFRNDPNYFEMKVTGEELEKRYHMLDPVCKRAVNILLRLTGTT
jgi:transcriptional regulator with XRE-family HTH domain